MLNASLVIKVLVLLLMLQGCTDNPHEVANVNFEVATVNFSIPSSFLSYSDDYNGGVQKTVTINTAYPSMIPNLDRLTNNLRTGNGVRILLHDHGSSSLDAWRRRSDSLGHKIIGEEKVYGLTKHLTEESILFDYFTYSKDNEVLMMISCPKRTSPKNIIVCVNRHKIINGNIYVSYLFEERLLSDVLDVDSKVEMFISGLNLIK